MTVSSHTNASPALGVRTGPRTEASITPTSGADTAQILASRTSAVTTVHITDHAVILNSGPTARSRRILTIPLDSDVGYSYVSNEIVVQPVAGHSREKRDEGGEGDFQGKIIARNTQHVPVVKEVGKSVIRRDSLKRREALLRGKEGSRRRQRWENDRLLHNPYVQAPTPSDWSPVPLPNPYKNKPIRYDLAQLWEHPTVQLTVLKNQQYAQQRKLDAEQMQNPNEPSCGNMPRELKQRLKKARGAAGLLRNLEEEVRKFIIEQKGALAQVPKKKTLPQPSSSPKAIGDMDSKLSPSETEEEILFRPKKLRNRQPATESKPTGHSTTLLPPQLPPPPPVKPLHHACPSDPSAGFTRWLIHSIARYYGLRSWSVTNKVSSGTDSVQEVRTAYVGIMESKWRGVPNRGEEKSGQHVNSLPRPLWGML